jgi:indole-3-glycerol phosphate synthase
MTILDKIIAHKRKETDERKALYPLALLEKSPFYEAQCVSMRTYLTRSDKSGIIAEFKRKSPSAVFNQYAQVEDVSIGYMQAGASAISVLTDAHYFGGSSDDLRVARTFNFCPILRKDFIFDPYQVHEARSIGADCVLLIASVLTKRKIAELTRLAQGLGMECLLEIASEEELEKYTPEIDILGVNNRDLHTMTCDLQRSLSMAPLLEDIPIKISESGLSNAEDVARVKQHGFAGCLIGSAFMREPDPPAACYRMVQGLKKLEHAPTPVKV